MATKKTNGRKRDESIEMEREEPALIPWMSSPFSMMRRFADEMDRAFGSLGRPADWPRGFGSRGAWSPQVEMFERDGNLIVHADLPGLKKEDVNLEVRKNSLVIEGERKETREEEEKGYYHSERTYGHFYRRIPLPEEVDTNQVTATFRDGVLEVKMPAPERSQAQGNRRIDIQ